tara:strand:+ start:491 stop:670 length:180 start_codon:yes stop_codon:yes gene_type:complete
MQMSKEYEIEQINEAIKYYKNILNTPGDNSLPLFFTEDARQITESISELFVRLEELEAA